MKILDVGSGHRPVGDVCLDLYPENNPHIGKTEGETTKVTKFFVQGDVNNLPFADNCFMCVFASHVLEHLVHPVEALKEMKRVATKLVYLKVPDASHIQSEFKGHIYSWNPDTFKHLCRTVFPTVQIYPTHRWQKTRFTGITIVKRSYEWFLTKFFSHELTAICACN